MISFVIPKLIGDGFFTKFTGFCYPSTSRYTVLCWPPSKGLKVNILNDYYSCKYKMEITVEKEISYNL